jgi:tetratricopeptide (TPR) repeat protein
MMKRKYIFAAISALLMSATVLSATDFREILKLQKRGMHNRASVMYNDLSRQVRSSDPEGYAILSDVILKVNAEKFAYPYLSRMEDYIKRNPHSVLVPQMRLMHALNVFENQDYRTASYVFEEIPASQLYDDQLDEYLFKKAYCALELGNEDRALLQFMELATRPHSDYTAPAQYTIAYINYTKGNISDALKMFNESKKDSRFKGISNYYIMDCSFYLKDYKSITEKADSLYEEVIDNRKPYVARIISKSFLILDNSEKSREYLDKTNDIPLEEYGREDWFHKGSVLYAEKDYKNAIENFNKMGDRADSLGQIANYYLGDSYIQTKNKVAAMAAFKDAVQSDYNPEITRDAYFNWAKLAFDINKDTAIFNDYMKKYPDGEKDDQIHNYMAVASLYERDYTSAIESYGHVEVMDERMKRNYMKANYLRAEELIGTRAYSDAIPYLNTAKLYSEQMEFRTLNQMSRFWIAESYFRTANYEKARELYTELYHESALFRQPESYLLSFNIAYCYFQEGKNLDGNEKQVKYKNAQEWFNKYLDEDEVNYRREALNRAADCYYILADYKNAAYYYDKLLDEYFDVNDIWPYWRSAISYGLTGNQSMKVAHLSKVLGASPAAPFYPEALYELGRAYVMLEQDDKAFDCFKMLSENVKDTNWKARAYIEMGSLSRNQGELDEALNYYKTVVSDMPLSDRVVDALAAIESIYMTKNNPMAYLEYIEGVGRGEMVSDDEKEEMIFNTAEQVYFMENYERVLVLLQTYLEKYPSGKYAYKAEFYTAQAHRIIGNLEQACDYYAKVIMRGETSYSEESMMAFSELSYILERWNDAFDGYSRIYTNTKKVDDKNTALVGMMRSAYRMRNWEETLKSVNIILGDSTFDQDVKREASYMKAKSLMASSKRDEAIAVLEKLAENVSDQYGAEAEYMLILDLYDRGEFEAVEEKVIEFADRGTRYPYWMAKSFIVLGDAYMEMGEKPQAKATYESVRDGYKATSPNDDIKDIVRKRLAKIK